MSAVDPSRPPRRERHRGARSAIAAALLLALLVAPALSACGSSPRLTSPTTNHRDFMFQIEGYHTRNQGGQTVDMYFYYRYDPDLPESRLPNYIALRDDAYQFMDTVDVAKNPYWETLNAELCHRLKDKYPIEAISCQMQVKGDLDGGVRYEPGYHSSVETIGDVPPLQIPGPREEDAPATPS